MENEQLVDRIVNNGTADSLEEVVREYFSTHPTAVDAIFEWTALGEDGDDINFTLKVERNWYKMLNMQGKLKIIRLFLAYLK